VGTSSNTGTCELCGHRGPKSEMARHLEECASSHDRKGPDQTLIILRFEAAGNPRYWIHAEARADATLRQVDSFLRHLWLECCGHMSAFYVAKAEPGMSSTVGATFRSRGLKFRYEYDFGSTTVLNGQVLGSRRGSIGRSSVRLLARNDPLVWSCAECKAAATTVCPFCIDSDACLFCQTHAGAHEHADEEVYLPVVNSPRMGVCGYTG